MIFSFSDDDLKHMPQSLRDGLFQEFAKHFGPEAAPAVPDLSADTPEAKLSVAQARVFLVPCKNKTESTLRAIASSDGPKFLLKAMEQTLSPKIGSMDNVWSALTRRVRTVTNDKRAVLISFREIRDASGAKEWEGTMSPVTHASFRTVFGMK